MEAPIIPICNVRIPTLILAGAAAVATVPPAGADTATIATYLKARAADGAGQVEVAAAGYARALAASPTNTVIAAHAYREALAAGDVALATRAAAVLRGTTEAPKDAALLPLAIAAAGNDPANARAAIDALAASPLAILAPSLRAWLAFTQGADPAPYIASAAATKNPVTQRLAAETAALLQIARGDSAGGLVTVQTLRETGSPIDLRLSAAQLLFGRGEGEVARALLTGDGPVFAALRVGVAAKPTLAFGVSRLLARVAGDLADQDAAPLSIALARAALVASPANDRARLLLAAALARDGAVARALAVLDAVPDASPFASAATDARLTILDNANRAGEALALARQGAEAPGATRDAWQAYADRLVVARRFAEAADWYRRIVAAAPTQWVGWMQYGGALEQAGDWPAARVALQKAVALAPQEPLALNYLGYAQATRGIDLPASIAMLEQARALKPDDGSIVDSLGWALYCNGDVARALPLIQSAAAGDPRNAEIGEHLGDAYWSVGRRYEARYAWRAAALTAAAAADESRLAAKIASGLIAR